LKINLLPPHIFEKRRMRNSVLVFAALVAAVAAGMFGWYSVLSARERDLTTEVLGWEEKANAVKILEAQAAAEEAKSPPIKQKVDFIEQVMAYNGAYPKIYEELAKYTYSRILYRSIEPTATQIKIGARARSVGDCGRYMLNMYRASHILSSVTIDAVPGWSGGIPRGFDFNATCNLKTPVTVPAYAGKPGQPGAPM